MIQPVHLLLGSWSALAAVWWLLAVGLVARRPRPPGATPESPPRTSAPGRVTVFKALPPLGNEAARDAIADAVGSFVRQLDAQTELVLGVPQEAEAGWAPIVAAWRQQPGGAHLRVRVRETPTQRANPKVAWFEVLARDAAGTHWLWSDADIIAPDGLLHTLRGELAAAGGAANAVTAAYFVGDVANVPGLLDALFVNAEFLPGALLLGRLGTVRLSFGAAVLFSARDFFARTTWPELGACLADDYVLGQRLGPVRISSQLVATTAVQPDFATALKHLYRWQKTIRWCRPGSFAALLLILPLLGWLVRCVWAPKDLVAWAGLLGQLAFEGLAAVALMRLVAARMPVRCWWSIAGWPVLRALGWVAAWLPVPVVWGEGRPAWRRPFQNDNGRPN